MNKFDRSGAHWPDSEQLESGRGLLKSAALCVFVFLGAACSNDDVTSSSGQPVSCSTPEQTAGSASRAFVATRTGDYTAGQVERISLSAGDISDGSYTATGSDIFVATDGCHVYEIGKLNLDSITKWDPDNLNNLIYQRSVAGEESSANPYQLVFSDITAAFVIRYGSDKIWQIDPSASNDADFKTGELDLSAYNDLDGLPEASAGVLVGNKLFVLLERLENFSVVQQGYIAVFDITTGEEIDTGKGGADGLKGIPLGINNPAALQYSSENGLIYAVGRGNHFAPASEDSDRYSGGIISLNPDTYDLLTLLDDGNEQFNYGFFVDLLVTDENQAYLVTQQGFDSNTLYKLELANPVLDAAVADMTALGITTLAKGPAERLWVGLSGTSPGFRLLNLTDDSVAKELVATTLVPINLVFVDTLQP